MIDVERCVSWWRASRSECRSDPFNIFYSYALVEFWVQACGYDWLTPDTRPWCRITVSHQLIRCCWPLDV